MTLPATSPASSTATSTSELGPACAKRKSATGSLYDTTRSQVRHSATTACSSSAASGGRRHCACAARRIHRPDLSPAAHLADRIRPGLRDAGCAPRALRRRSSFPPAGSSSGWTGASFSLLAPHWRPGVTRSPASRAVWQDYARRWRSRALDRARSIPSPPPWCPVPMELSSRGPLGTYNFTGDLGKAAIPALTSLLLTLMPWRGALWLLAVLGAVVAAAVLLLMPPIARAGRSQPLRTKVGRGRGGFWLLFVIGVLDTGLRTGLLTFLPFLLKAKGASMPTVGVALALVFLGGAAGKFVCGWLGARAGVLKTGTRNGRRNGGMHRGGAGVAACSVVRAAAGRGRHVERHVVRALRHGSGTHAARSGRTRLCPVLHWYNRIGRNLPRVLRCAR